MSEDKKSFQKIDDYSGDKKWLFAVTFNRACDNLGINENNNQISPVRKLFSESLLKFEQVNRKDWFGEETREKIRQVEEDGTVVEKLNKIRNYFSHYYHKDDCLCFLPEDPIRIIMEKAYQKAREKVVGRQTEEYAIKIPESSDLFETRGQITPAGAVFFASFFVERRFLSRLMGDVSGFKKTEGQYNATREIFFTYCLKDSYSISTPSPQAAMFRDILGYLSRVPAEYYKYRKEQCDTNNMPERKTDKFISFALKYLEEFAFKNLPNYTASFGRVKITREKIEQEDDNEQYKPNPNQGKVRIVDASEQPYYINHNTAILRIQKNDGKGHSCKIGINELKYLVLLCLRGKTQAAIGKIHDGYLCRLEEIVKTNEDVSKNKHKMPEFILKHSGLYPIAKETAARLKHIREKWEKKKLESAKLELHRKSRDILRYLNWHCKNPLKQDLYDELLTFLNNKRFEVFNARLNELKRIEQISENVWKSLKDVHDLNTLHIKVCDLVLAKLENLEKNEPGKLAEHIGLIRKAAHENSPAPSYEAKVKAFIDKPMIYNGFLRNQFFSADKKSFAVLVKETLGQNPDVPLGADFYFVPEIKLETQRHDKKNLFHKDNAVLYETLALDRLCVMMARKRLENINPDLQKTGQKIEWKKENGKDFIYLEIDPDKLLQKADNKQKQNPKGAFGTGLNIPVSKIFTIRFDKKHYTKLYVMDDAKFLSRLMQHFFADKKIVDYYELYSDGERKYTDTQRDGMQAILRFEEEVVKQENLPCNSDGYIDFSEIVKKSRQSSNEFLLSLIRRNIFHYHLAFTPADYNSFTRIMQNGGYWNVRKTEKKPKK